VSDNFGSHVAFNTLTAFAAIGLVAVVLAMPETKPRLEVDAPQGA
jgi:hypothetical protein